MSIRVARAFGVLAILLHCNMAAAQEDITPFLPAFTPEEQSELARGRAANPPPPPAATPNKELEAAVASAAAVASDSVRGVELGQDFVRMICDDVKGDTAHKTPGYRFVEDRARACVDDVNLSRNLGVTAPELTGGRTASADQRAYLACMARECEDRVLRRLFAQ